MKVFDWLFGKKRTEESAPAIPAANEQKTLTPEETDTGETAAAESRTAEAEAASEEPVTENPEIAEAEAAQEESVTEDPEMAEVEAAQEEPVTENPEETPAEPEAEAAPESGTEESVTGVPGEVMEAAGNTEVAEKTEAAENTEAAGNTEAVESKEAVDNTEAVESTEAIVNTEAAGNTEAAESTEAAGNTEAAENTDAVKGTEAVEDDEESAEGMGEAGTAMSAETDVQPDGREQKEKKRSRKSLYDRKKQDKKRGRKNGGKNGKKQKHRTLKIRDLVLGEGMPAICVPLTGETEEELLQQAAQALEAEPDLVEWRADYFEGLQEPETAEAALCALRKILGNIPILFTVRTSLEGGELPYEADEYEKLIRWGIGQTETDLIDIEVLHYETDPAELTDFAHLHGKTVVASAHFFRETPGKEELRQLFYREGQTGADILKVAAMPEKPKDVLRLMQVTRQVWEETGKILITMSMGEMGKISRVSGALTGSAVTFGTAGWSSAPGQISADELRAMLRAL